jgi:hypothetical protein
MFSTPATGSSKMIPMTRHFVNHCLSLNGAEMTLPRSSWLEPPILSFIVGAVIVHS